MQQYSRIGTGRALSRALLGWTAFVVASALAGVGAVHARTAGAGEAVVAAVPAAITLGVTVPLVLLVHRRHRTAMALRRPGRAVTGVAVTAAAAALVFGLALLAGGLRITAVDLPALVTFLVTNTALALALEALPEELALRGSVYGSLAEVSRGWVAGVATTGAFLVAPAASIGLAAGIGRALGLPVPPPTFAPGGQDPVAYAVVLAVFGTVLVLARAATGSVWTGVGVHLTFLTVNRALLSGGRLDTGLSLDASPGSELLVLVYLLLAAAVFAVLIRSRSRTRRRAAAAAALPGRG